MADKKELNVEEMEKVNGGLVEKIIDKTIDKGLEMLTGKGGKDESAPPASGGDTFNQGKNENLKSLQQNSTKGTNTQNNITIN